MVLLVQLILINQLLTISLIREEYLGLAQILDCLIEVFHGTEGLASPRQCLVAQVFLLLVAIIEHFTVFENASAVIHHVLPHLKADPGQRTIRVEWQHILDLFKRIGVVLVSTLVQATLHAVVAFIFK